METVKTNNPALMTETKKSIPATSAKAVLFHAVSGETASNILDVKSKDGLTGAEARRRLNLYGANRLKESRNGRIFRLVLAQFSSVVVWLLALAAVIAFLTESVAEGAAIIVVLLLNACIGFLIEWRAGRALDALKKATRVTVRVRRDRTEQLIDAKNLVAGDIVILSAGDKVPADARILEAAHLRADESTLTGESLTVEKHAEAVEENAPLAERRSMLYLGTNIVAGFATAIVTATGAATEIGRIGRLVSEATAERTPLERRLAQLGKSLVYIVVGIALIVFFAGYLRGENLWLMLEVAVSLAVAAVPEGLPAVTTLILALGVLRMAQRHAIVRKLSAVETLGSTTVICTDKTGTLTENRMTVSEYRLADKQMINVLETSDSFLPPRSSRAISIDSSLSRLMRVSVLCNTAALSRPANNQTETDLIGDPTEIALLEAAAKFGFEIEAEKDFYEKIAEQPFDSKTKKMTVVSREKSCGKIFAALKGAPGVILDACDKFLGRNGEIFDLTEAKRSEFLQINEEMASRALRVLAFAENEDAANFSAENSFLTGGTFLGFAGMIDPPREGAKFAVSSAHRAGIRVVMLTGDQIETARAVARELNLSSDGDVFALHSNDLTGAESSKLVSMARRAHVFARVSPEDKFRIVRALQEAGETVAVTGDGVNDAPALKQSDIGVAMGLHGTEAAKEASDIILTDDNFGTIVQAIEGGRAIYANIIKFVHLMFSHNLGELLVIFAAIFAGLPLPLLPLQILWMNLVTDVFPALALAVEPPLPETMTRPPRPPKETLLSKNFLFLISWQGTLLAAIALAAYLWALQKYGAGAHSQTVALFALIGVQLGHLFNCRSRTRSMFDRFFSNPAIFAAALAVILLQIAAISIAPLARILGLVSLAAVDWAIIALCTILPPTIVEIVKFSINTRTKKRRVSVFS